MSRLGTRASCTQVSPHTCLASAYSTDLCGRNQTRGDEHAERKVHCGATADHAVLD